MTDEILTDAERLERLETTVAYQDQAKQRAFLRRWAEAMQVEE